MAREAKAVRMGTSPVARMANRTAWAGKTAKMARAADKVVNRVANRVDSKADSRVVNKVVSKVDSKAGNKVGSRVASKVDNPARVAGNPAVRAAVVVAEVAEAVANRDNRASLASRAKAAAPIRCRCWSACFGASSASEAGPKL